MIRKMRRCVIYYGNCGILMMIMKLWCCVVFVAVKVGIARSSASFR